MFFYFHSLASPDCLFSETENLDIASYADDNVPFTSSSELNKVLQKLQIKVDKIFKWFQNNCFKSHSEKMSLTTCKSEVHIRVSKKKFFRCKCYKNRCKKASKKTHALSRSSKVMDVNKRRLHLK